MIVGGQTKVHASTLIDYRGLFDLASGLKGSGLMTHETEEKSCKAYLLLVIPCGRRKHYKLLFMFP